MIKVNGGAFVVKTSGGSFTKENVLYFGDNQFIQKTAEEVR